MKLLQSVWRFWAPGAGRRKNCRRPTHRLPLRLELLESRLTPSDGFGAGTVLVKDINPGGVSSYLSSLTDVNGTLFFTSNDGVHGPELWKSNGTATGTVLVKDINPGAGGSYPTNLTSVNGTLFFAADDGTHGRELWKSDGTAAGTVLVKDINPGTNNYGPLSSLPNKLTNVNGTLFFIADDGKDDGNLWKTDGTAAGTVLVKSVFVNSSYPMANVNGTLFFTATSGNLWKSDGTDAGTVMVKSLIGVHNLTDVNGTLFFAADDGTTGTELWKSDGTTAGTVLVKDIYTGSTTINYNYRYNHNHIRFHNKVLNSSDPGQLTNVNGTLYFSANDGMHGVELWKSDGTATGTVLVKDINKGKSDSFLQNLTNANGTLFFTANDSTHGIELWKSDGTTTGTVLVKDINPGTNPNGLPGSSSPAFLTSAGGTLYFSANDGATGDELWKSDGTAAGTVLIADISPGSAGSYPQYLTLSGGHLFFSADDAVHGRELWDPPVSGTLTVTNNHDSGAGSLRDAIGHAKSGDTIRFDPSLNGQTIVLTSDELAISKSLDIEGPGPGLLAVSGNSSSRVFDVSQNQQSVVVTIAVLTIENGRSPGGGYGGGIYNVGTTLNLTNDVLSNNVARGSPGNGGRGGAVCNVNGATLTVSNCTFSGNQATGSAGGNFAGGGGIDNEPGGILRVSQSTFNDNRAQGGDGGTISHNNPFIGLGFGGGIQNFFATATIDQCTFTGNQAVGGSGGSGGAGASQYDQDAALGGGVWNYGTSSMIVRGSTFAYNQAIGGSNATVGTGGMGHVGDAGGGGLETEGGGTVTITDSTFDHNQAIGGSNIQGNGNNFIAGWGHGGAISNSSWTPTAGTAPGANPSIVIASNLTITNNQAVGGAGDTGPLAGLGDGGGIENWYGGAFTISDSTIANNQAIGGAGAAGQNGADGLGGAIANVMGATFTISNCTMAGNQAIGGAGGSGGNGGNGFGGGLYNQGNSSFGTSSLTITGSTVTGNSATGGAAGSGGSAGEGIGGGAYFAVGGDVCLDTFTQSNVKKNHASTSDDDIFGAFTTCS